VIITQSGDLPFTHNLFQRHRNVEKLIVTSEKGLQRFVENARIALNIDRFDEQLFYLHKRYNNTNDIKYINN
jgi:riboflavin biosynthesis pyrimidine reductase